GTMVAYLGGRVTENAVWGTHVFIDAAAHAAADPEALRDLYAHLAPAWLAAGARLHLALVPALRELAAPWFRLAFGHMQVYALRESGAPERPLPAGVRIRPGTLADIEATTPLQLEIWRHQQRSPVFTGLAEPDPAA